MTKASIRAISGSRRHSRRAFLLLLTLALLLSSLLLGLTVGRC